MIGIVNGPIPADFMSDISNRLSAARFKGDDDTFEVLDQLLLPHMIDYIPIKSSEEAFAVIRSMQVRGAPLIAVVGIRGLLLDLLSADLTCSPAEFIRLVKAKAAYLVSSRPTAINLQNALTLVAKASEMGTTTLEKFRSTKSVILKIYNDEQEENRRLVWNGYQEILSLKPADHQFTVMTICNTGSLATVSWGTALGVIRGLHEAGRLKMVYALETRPYNQGIRLTASELSHGSVPFKIITDSMAAYSMKKHLVDAVLVGADQVALNGDTANKIGTYMLAVLAKYHNIPFYPVVPFTTINVSRDTGDDIPIEERPPIELIMVNGGLVGAETTPVWNPAFDVTPGHLIRKVITDFGNFAPDQLRSAVAKVQAQLSIDPS